jgi:hypothetical protein
MNQFPELAAWIKNAQLAAQLLGAGLFIIGLVGVAIMLFTSTFFQNERMGIAARLALFSCLFGGFLLAAAPGIQAFVYHLAGATPPR